MGKAWFAGRKGQAFALQFGALGGLSLAAYDNRAVKRVRDVFLRQLAVENGHVPAAKRSLVSEGLSFQVTPLESAESTSPTKYHVAVTNLEVKEGNSARIAEFSYDQRTRKFVHEALMD